jgi:V/A-type H+-transporting ATPase subunit C
LPAILKNAKKYGYSSARVNAMKSRLLSQKKLQEISGKRNINEIISMLSDEDYRRDLEEFEGMKSKSVMVDFALSVNLARNLRKLVTLAKGNDREILRSVTGRWSMHNVRIAIEAKDRGKSFDSISKYLIDVGRYGNLVIKEAMREDSVESMLHKLMINSPYRKLLYDASEAYSKTHNIFETLSAMDKRYYQNIAELSEKLSSEEHWSASRVMKMEIDMRNVLTAIRAKKAGIKLSGFSNLLVQNGNIPKSEIENIYNSSKDLAEMVSQLKFFDLGDSLAFYNNDESKRLLVFEVGIRRAMIRSAEKYTGHRILSFATMLSYLYMKEAEVYMLRIIANGSEYGLDRKDMSMLIGWKTAE